MIYDHKHFYVLKTFTFMHFSIAEKLAKKEIELSDIPDDILEGLIYNIFPGGNTILNILSNDVE